MKRRAFLKTAAVAAGSAAMGTSLHAGTTTQPFEDLKVSKIAFPEKKPLITYSDRPPLLESPRSVFTHALTPNDEFFVRWHMPEIPTHIDPHKYVIKIDGLVSHEQNITLAKLKSDYFEQVEITAVLQCGGNGRSAFHPTAGGIQWGNGAMGCAKWKGVRLKDILKKARLKKDAEWIAFNGLDNAAYYKTPNFVREIHIDEVSDDVIIAYEMNGEDLPYLNGYPVRLVMPGYYSDNWVKMLSHLHVTDKYKSMFFMDTAYRIPDNACECETPTKRAKKTKPIEHMNVKSIIGFPTENTIVQANSHVVVRGMAFDDGHGIKAVLVSLDKGKTWKEAILGEDSGKYAFRPFRFAFKPATYGQVTIMTKAVNKIGQAQPFAKDIGWNHGGYKYNGIDEVTIQVM